MTCEHLGKYMATCGNPPSGGVGEVHYGEFVVSVVPNAWMCSVANDPGKQKDCVGYEVLKAGWAVKPEGKPNLYG